MGPGPPDGWRADARLRRFMHDGADRILDTSPSPSVSAAIPLGRGTVRYGG
jgi:hypothetical protein